MTTDTFIKYNLRCLKDFKFFKAGEVYWLEHMINGEYSVRSDNALGQHTFISEKDLFRNFETTDEQSRL